MNYHYCPKCGTKYPKTVSTHAPQCQACNYVFYENSSPTVSAIFLDDGKTLLGRRAIEPHKGKWDVIGGFLEYHEHPTEGLQREVQEETGLLVEPTKYLGSIMGKYNFQDEQRSTLNLFFQVKIIGGQEKPGDDISELQWFDLTDIPKDIAFKNGQEMLNTLINN